MTADRRRRIPHVYGRSDADAVFGLMYAQAEDGFERIETNYLNALGRMAEVRAAWDGTFVPVFHTNQQAFFRAFGDHLRAVRLAELEESREARGTGARR